MLAKLALEDGHVFTGTAFGARGTRTGEVVFNTSMTGYQEIFSDPSYCGQIVVLTFPLIGNYGVNDADGESRRPRLSGLIVKESARRPSNHRATATLEQLLAEQGVIGLSDVDTRALTRAIRLQGAVRGIISTEISDEVELVRQAAASESMVGANLVTRVAPATVSTWTETVWSPVVADQGPERARPHGPAAARAVSPRGVAAGPVVASTAVANAAVANAVAAGTAAASTATAQKPLSGGLCRVIVVDCGVKYNILRHLVSAGCAVTVVPPQTSGAAILDLAPDGVVVSNGPGDPAAVTDTIALLRDLLGRVRVLGICLGYQMAALALGARTYKLKFGHHGGNVPVLNHPAGRVEITAQNHGFAVEAESLGRVGGIVTHTNLNDGSLEGFVHPDRRLLAVQFHPEAGPGPHDAAYIFTRFVAALRRGGAMAPELLSQ